MKLKHYGEKMEKKPKSERAYKEVRDYVKDKIKLFSTCNGMDGKLTSRSSHILEILNEIKRIMDRA